MAVTFSAPLTVAKQADLALLKSANTALRGFARQDYTGILPDCPVQQRAYINLRMTKKRISPQKFLNHLATFS